MGRRVLEMLAGDWSPAGVQRVRPLQMLADHFLRDKKRSSQDPLSSPMLEEQQVSTKSGKSGNASSGICSMVKIWPIFPVLVDGLLIHIKKSGMDFSTGIGINTPFFVGCVRWWVVFFTSGGRDEI